MQSATSQHTMSHIAECFMYRKHIVSFDETGYFMYREHVVSYIENTLFPGRKHIKA